MSGIHQMLLAVSAKAFLLTLNTATNVNLRTQALAAGWNGTDRVIATIPSGQTLSATTTGNNALTISGSFPSGVEVVNQGTINGKGGAGGAGGVNTGNGATGSVGGTALSVSVATTFDNQGTINGGSGGQGGGAAVRTVQIGTAAGACSGSVPCISYDAYNGACGSNTGPTGATGGSTGANGATGATGSSANGGNIPCSSHGCSGPTGTAANCPTGTPGAGGAAGAAVSGNSNITWTSTGTRNGPIV